MMVRLKDFRWHRSCSLLGGRVMNKKKVILPIGLVVDGNRSEVINNLLSKEHYYKITKFKAICPTSNEIVNLPVDDIG